jgi:hypothetical protein
MGNDWGPSVLGKTGGNERNSPPGGGEGGTANRCEGAVAQMLPAARKGSCLVGTHKLHGQCAPIALHGQRTPIGLLPWCPSLTTLVALASSLRPADGALGPVTGRTTGAGERGLRLELVGLGAGLLGLGAGLLGLGAGLLGLGAGLLGLALPGALGLGLLGFGLGLLGLGDDGVRGAVGSMSTAPSDRKPGGMGSEGNSNLGEGEALVVRAGDAGRGLATTLPLESLLVVDLELVVVVVLLGPVVLFLLASRMSLVPEMLVMAGGVPSSDGSGLATVKLSNAARRLGSQSRGKPAMVEPEALGSLNEEP